MCKPKSENAKNRCSPADRTRACLVALCVRACDGEAPEAKQGMGREAELKGRENL